MQLSRLADPTSLPQPFREVMPKMDKDCSDIQPLKHYHFDTRMLRIHENEVADK